MKIKFKNGFSLIELMLALAIILIFMVGSFFLYSKVSDSRKMDKTMSDLGTIKAEVSNQFIKKRSLGSIDTNQAISLNIFPEYMISNDKTKVINAYGTDVTLQGGMGSDLGEQGSERVISVFYNDIPKDICINLSQKAAPIFKYIKVNGENVGLKKDYGNINEDRNIENTINACNNELNEIEFVIGL